MKVSPDAIKNFNEESVITNISCNFSDHAANNVNYNLNRADKLVEVMEENKKLYEELLRVEREKIALLERMLNERK